ncbi:exclusion suppressor [Candidatus Photodesmus blepharus]|uniref:Exclusion suppressor n=1 Tax=Candidatus Photodesmus blepharonis TaxID=1179155 RepID=A0A084CN31_9GAMM|nr:FxsA family protein [Candidatus Photodesmus blepharus]KEY91210.1 exclusion suppressor [Candidatus Photodesmus blepharus]
MLPVLLLLFIGISIVEIGLFVQVGIFLGLWSTIALTLITTSIGSSVYRKGLQILRSVQNYSSYKQLLEQKIFEGIVFTVSGILLLIPGFMTDVLGTLALFPKPYALIVKYLIHKTAMRSILENWLTQRSSSVDHSCQRGNTFEGEYEHKKEKEDR